MIVRGGHAQSGVWGLRFGSVQKDWSCPRIVCVLLKFQLAHLFLPTAEIWGLVGRLREWSLGLYFGSSGAGGPSSIKASFSYRPGGGRPWVPWCASSKHFLIYLSLYLSKIKFKTQVKLPNFMRIGDILIFCLLTYPKADRITKIQVSIFSFFFFQSKENITYPPHESFFFLFFW